MTEAFLDTPFGRVRISVTSNGINSLQFVSVKTKSHFVPSENCRHYIRQLEEYFVGARKSFQLEIDWSGMSSFSKEVLRIVQTIPYGKTRSYEQIANFLDNSHLARAIGQVNAHNPIPIIIPCHRVIGKRGKLRGYAYGKKIKQGLLEMENPLVYSHQIDLF